MKKKIYLVFILTQALSIVANHYTRDLAASYPIEMSELDEQALAYDEFDILADKQTAEGFKSSISANQKGLLGWLGLQVRKAGTSVVLSYVTASEWVSWFKTQAALAWFWLKRKVVR